MTVTLPPVNINTDNFVDWVNKTNNIIDALDTVVVTVGSTIDSDVEIAGDLVANNLTISSITGNSSEITINTPVVMANGSNITVDSLLVNGSNFTANTTSMIIQGATGIAYGATAMLSRTVTIPNVVPTAIHQFPKSQFTTAKYTLSVTVGNNKSSAEILLMNDGNATVLTTEYAMINSSVPLGTFSANNNATDTRLFFSPLQSNSVVKLHATLIES